MTIHWIDFSQVNQGRNPLNPIGAPLRSFILQELQVARHSASITSVVLIGGSLHFSAGADLTEFASFSSIPDESSSTTTTTLIDVVNAVENFPKPILAAVHGRAMGGGMELALACHYRIATSTSIWGLPEVNVGLIPGAGGTQRLPRLIGVSAALELILTGKTISGTRAHQLGIVNALFVPVGREGKSSSSAAALDELLQAAEKWANWAALMPVEGCRVGRRPVPETPEQVHFICRAAAKKLPPIELGGEAVRCALQAVQATSRNTLEEGLQVEEEMVMTCLVSSQGRARRHVFFAIRQAQKLISPNSTMIQNNNIATSSASIQQQDYKNHLLLTQASMCCVAVIGAGTMGGGIAMVLLQTGYSKVYLVDINPQALEKGVAFLEKTIQSMIQRQKINATKAQQFQKALVPTTRLEDLKDCHLVVEAVVENMKIKESIFSTLDRVTPPHCILLSNTSTLNIDQMAATLSPTRRTSFAGWHFFSPAHVMQLVEIVVGKDTTGAAVSLLQALTKKIGKIGVVVGNCDGFCGNRMVRPYGAEAVLLLAEGLATVEQVDAALSKQHGMALGPLAMSDLAGNDVGYNIRREHGWVRDQPGFDSRKRPARYTELADDLVSQLGRTGQKAGKGYYDYDPKIGKGYKPLPSKEVADFVEKYVKQPTPRNFLSPQQIIERVLFPLVNEGFKCLDNNIAQRPSDIDVIYIFGYGWPAWRGGPMWWADHDVGLDNLLNGLQRFSREFPETDHYLPSRLLEECVRLGITVEDYYKKGLHKRKHTGCPQHAKL